MYDLVIRNARIADGLGGPLVAGDLAVKDGRIAAVGKVNGRSAETVDAGGWCWRRARSTCTPTTTRS